MGRKGLLYVPSETEGSTLFKSPIEKFVIVSIQYGTNTPATHRLRQIHQQVTNTVRPGCAQGT